MFKIIRDSESGIPVAVSNRRAGSSISEEEKISIPNTSTPNSQGTQKTVPIEGTRSNFIPSIAIDVLNDYDWKVSPNNEIVDHPYILLKEFYVEKSSLLAQALYGIEATGESAFKSFEIISGATPVGTIAGALGIDASVLEDLRSRAGQFATELRNFTNTEDTSTTNELLRPYHNLYITRPTDFTYKFPYFSNRHTSKNSSWDANYSGAGPNIVTNLVKESVEFVASYGTGIPIFGSIAEPGLYIERGKYYQPLQGSESISVSFPLLNTLNKESLQKNFNLLWLIVFQNSSMRKNKTEIQPPCMYELLIPGVKYMKYSYIQNITIDYLGTRRKIQLTNPGTGKLVDTIVPEAYNVTLDFVSLTTDSGNFMLQSLNNTL